MDHYGPFNDNILLLGDFNSEIKEISMNEFCEAYNLKNVVKEPICFKTPLNPTCIDLMLTNRPNSFQNTLVIETSLSDFHKMTVPLLKTCTKSKPLRLYHIVIISTSNELFQAELNLLLSSRI